MIILGTRGSGKTWRLVQLSAEKQIPIMAHNTTHIKHIMQIAKEQHLSIPNPILFTQSYGMNHPTVLIDEAEMLLEQLINTKIDSFTCGREDAWEVYNYPLNKNHS